MKKESVQNASESRPENKKPVTPDLVYRSLFEFNPDMVLFMDVDGKVRELNDGLAKTLGLTVDEIMDNSFEKYISKQNLEGYQTLFQDVLTGKSRYKMTELMAKSESTIPVALNLFPALRDNKVIGVFGIIQDLTDIKEYEQELYESELKFKSIADGALIGIYIVREDGLVTYANKKFYDILGLPEGKSDVIFRDYVHEDFRAEINKIGEALIDGEEGMTHSYRMVRADGKVIDVESHSTKIELQNELFITATLEDITERKKAAELNEYMAYHDYLTDLPNQRYFRKKLDEDVIICKTLGHSLTVMLLDLDRFKHINDSLGHTMGDRLVKKVAERLKGNLRENDFLARTGGDEFAIILPGTGFIDIVVDYAKKIIAALEEPFYINDYELYITTSIGISVFPEDGEDSETLIKHADSAVFKAKAKGKNTFQVFTPSMDTEAFKIFTLESGLRRAIKEDQLELHYQPQICATTKRILGAEALIRWNHPEWGMVYPNEFLPIAEETGLIIEIGKWVKKKACEQNKAWQEAGLPPIPVSINLSAHRFLDKNLINNIKQVLEETNLDPEYFRVEIVESSILENEKNVSTTLEQLKEMGIKVSLDDFGTGFSSLSYLRKFKGMLDTLKLDRSFINDLSTEGEENSNYIAETIIDVAHHLNMETVAEGVETHEQLEILQAYKCKQIQGYLFSKPVPADEFAELLKNGRIDPPGDDNADSERREETFIVSLDAPLCASMTLTKINGREVQLGERDVLIEKIGPSCMQFLSDIRLPIQRDVLFKFETEILGEGITIYGKVVWTKELQNGIFQYIVDLTFDEKEQSSFIDMINKVSEILLENRTIPNSNTIEVDWETFFKRVKA